MKISSMKKSKRIALISIAAALIAVCSPVSAFADGPVAKVIYTGNGTTSAVDVPDVGTLDAFEGLMPNGPAKSQDIEIWNNSNKRMMVYFQAIPSNASSAVDLLNELDLTVTFKMDDDSQTQILYSGKASGNKSNPVDPSNSHQVTNILAASTAKIPLGYVDKNSQSGKITATLSAPETMDNTFADASAAIKWVFQFQLADPTHNGGGGGGGGGGANAPGNTVISSLPPVESLAPESIPQGGPASSSPTSSPESIPNESVPLSKPPKTGETPIYLWIVLVAALVACAVFVAARGKTKSSGKNH